MPLTPERLVELRHVAEQAASLPNGPWGHRYLSEFIPGVVLELLDMIPNACEPPGWLHDYYISTICPGCGQMRTSQPPAGMGE